MPGRSNSGGESFYRASHIIMTRNIGQVEDSAGDGSPHRRNGNAYQGRGDPHRLNRKMESYLADDQNFPSFKSKLRRMGLQLRDIPADGNCLFRALGDQLEGHGRNHYRHRSDVVNFMKSHRLDFEPFVEDDLPFDEHVKNLQKLGTHAGNDAIVAFAKVHNLNIIIHMLEGKPLLIQGPKNSTELTPQLHLAYHNGDHYSSVRKLDDNTESPAHIRLQEYVDKPEQQHRYQGPSDSQHTYHTNGHEISGAVVSARRDINDIVSEVQVATNCDDVERVQQCIMECDFDVDASIAYLMQQLEMSNELSPDETASLMSGTTDSGICNGSLSPGSDNGLCSSDCSSSTLRNGSMTPPTTGGKGHKVHFREDSISSGYSSISSAKGIGARPKVMSLPVQSSRKVKESKKMEKKRRAEERHREKVLNSNGLSQPKSNIPEDVRNVTVIAMHEGKLTRI